MYNYSPSNPNNERMKFNSLRNNQNDNINNTKEISNNDDNENDFTYSLPNKSEMEKSIIKIIIFKNQQNLLMEIIIFIIIIKMKIIVGTEIKLIKFIIFFKQKNNIIIFYLYLKD